MAQAIATVRCELQGEHHIVQAQDLGQRASQWRVGRQDKDAFARVLQLQLGFRAEHPKGFHTANFALRDLQSVWKLSADLRQADFVAGFHVLSAANDVEWLA